MPVVHIHTKKEGENEQKYKQNKEKAVRQLNDYLNKNKDVYVLIYMNGCGPCEATKPKWHEIQNNYNVGDDVCVADIEHTLLENIENDLIKKDVTGFPTIRHIKGNKMYNYEDIEGIKKDRSLESFIHWLEMREKGKKQSRKLKKLQLGGSGTRKNRKRRGGKWSLKYKKSINCRRPKGFSQRQHCKYGRVRGRAV